MTEMTPDGVAGAAYAAGKAEAVAEDAHDNAQEAAQDAEVARDVAEAANENAWSARDAVDELREEVRAGFDSFAQLIGQLGSKKDTDTGDADGGPKAPASKKDTDTGEAKPAKAKDTAEPAKTKKSSGWFAGR